MLDFVTLVEHILSEMKVEHIEIEDYWDGQMPVYRNPTASQLQSLMVRAKATFRGIITPTDAWFWNSNFGTHFDVVKALGLVLSETASVIVAFSEQQIAQEDDWIADDAVAIVHSEPFFVQIAHPAILERSSFKRIFKGAVQQEVNPDVSTLRKLAAELMAVRMGPHTSTKAKTEARLVAEIVRLQKVLGLIQ